MNDEVKVEKLNAKIIKNNKFRKEHEPELAALQKWPFIKLFLIIAIVFLSYLTVSIMLITFGVISMHQSLWKGNLLNGLSSMPWGIILFAIGFFMILPILRYIKTLIKFLINQYKLQKQRE